MLSLHVWCQPCCQLQSRASRRHVDLIKRTVSSMQASPLSKSRSQKQREKRSTTKAAAVRRGEGSSPDMQDGVDMNALNAMMPRKVHSLPACRLRASLALRAFCLRASLALIASCSETRSCCASADGPALQAGRKCSARVSQDCGPRSSRRCRGRGRHPAKA